MKSTLKLVTDCVPVASAVCFAAVVFLKTRLSLLTSSIKEEIPTL